MNRNKEFKVKSVSNNDWYVYLEAWYGYRNNPILKNKDDEAYQNR